MTSPKQIAQRYSTAGKRGLLYLVPVGLALAAAYIIAGPLLLAVFETDNAFRLHHSLSARSIYCLNSAVTWDTLARSAVLGGVAAAIGLMLVSFFLALLRQSWFVAILLLAAYSVDPLTRGRAYRGLFEASLSLALITERLDWFIALLIPATALALQYCPLFLFLRFIESSEAPSLPPLSPIGKLLFLRIPSNFQRFPFEFALFFLLAFFDLWLVRVVTGAKANYWGPLLIHRALNSRDLAAGATMVLLGLGVVLCVFALAQIFSTLAARAWLRLSPLSMSPLFLKLGSNFYTCVEWIAGTLGLLLAIWPLLTLGIRVTPLMVREEFQLETLGEPRAIIIATILSASCAFISVVSGILLIAANRSKKPKHRLLLISSTILALAPEAAFLLCCALLTATRVLQLGLPLTMLALLSFSVPIAYLCWDGALSGSDKRKLDLISEALPFRLTFSASALFREFLGVSLGISLLLAWLVAEDIVLVDFVSSPGNKPFSALMFASAQRGVSDSEAFWAAAAWLTRLVVMIAIVFPHYLSRFRKQRPSTQLETAK